MKRAGSTLLPLLLTVPLAACSAIQFGGDPVPDLQGTWDGTVLIEGENVRGTLGVSQVEESLQATFQAPALDLRSEGAGEVDGDGGLWLETTYAIECPGTARFEGRLSEDGTRLSGTVRAADCTGIVNGTFSFTRR